MAYAIAAAVGGTAYALGFLALSSFTSRALAIGLAYVLLWEGVLSGLFEGTQVFSVRQATMGLAAVLQGIEGTGDTHGRVHIRGRPERRHRRGRWRWPAGDSHAISCAAATE